MNWLLWKDYRVNRTAFGSALFFLVVPHFVALCAVCWQAWFRLRHDPGEWTAYFAAATAYGFMFAQLSIGLVGGNAFAGERADRSAEFLVSLPVSRGKNIVSKLLVSATLIVAIWLISLLVLANLLASSDVFEKLRPRDYTEIGRVIRCVAILSATFFCVAWCLSSFSRSTTFAVLGGLFTPWLIMVAIAAASYLFDADLDKFGDRQLPVFTWICATLAPICFATGTWYYLRRVEP
jgi:hypothetical protein